ncbi:MAG: helix-turn-helix transcriptional regulator [Nostoc sp. ZfuVER08]|jgi:predicted ArsR family transcriptional regulator|nr:metalloregulator ArsR/SmtB family transcription factor [Nostoc sp. ZfuVER08]
MKSELTNKSATVRTRRAILKLLKLEGSMDALALASRLNVTAMAVRQHLYALQEEQLVTYHEESRSMGRPAKLWQLTSAADSLFPERYAELTLSLLNSVKEAFGEEGLDRLLEIRTRQQILEYREKIPSAGSVEQRLEALAAKRTEEGYMAEIQCDADGSFLLIENHCPICAAAVTCTGLCRQELEVFQSVLGSNAVIERTEHIVTGERRCVYRVISCQVKDP